MTLELILAVLLILATFTTTMAMMNYLDRRRRDK